MNQTLERLKDIETNGYQVDFANVFNHAFENYKKIALYAGLVLFVFMVLFTILIAGSLVSVIGVTAMTQELNPEKLKIENFSENTLLILGVISIFVGSILAPFNASFLKMADCGDKDEEFHILTGDSKIAMTYCYIINFSHKFWPSQFAFISEIKFSRNTYSMVYFICNYTYNTSYYFWELKSF